MPFLLNARRAGVRTGQARATVTVLTLLVALIPQDALAYIDPGYGVLLVQAILSGFFGFLFLARNTVRRVLGRLFGVKTSTPEATSEGHDASSSGPGSPG